MNYAVRSARACCAHCEVPCLDEELHADLPEYCWHCGAQELEKRKAAALAEATPTTCANCDEPTRPSELRAVYGYDEPWCVSCIADAAERQQEASDERYYGGEL